MVHVSPPLPVAIRSRTVAPSSMAASASTYRFCFCCSSSRVAASVAATPASGGCAAEDFELANYR
jgi:hypothetical protein